MSDSEGPKEGENLNFRWGIKKVVGGKNNNVHFYESFIYEGVEYFLYDSVVFYRQGELETYIGKLAKIYETPSRAKKVKILWFFRPIEIQNFLNDYKPAVNELFLGSGEGVGLFNINPLESIRQKCNVLCTSNDRRNPQVSEEELNQANYIFHRTFDVGKLKIEESFPKEIAGVKVEKFFNRKNDQALVNNLNVKKNDRECTGESSSSSTLRLDIAAGNAVKGGNSGIRLSPGVKESKRAAANVDKHGYLPSGNAALRSVAKSKIEKSFGEKTGEAKVLHFSNRKKDKAFFNNSNSTVGDRTGKFGSSSLGLDKAVGGAVKVGTSGIRESIVAKELRKVAFNVNKPGHFPSDTGPDNCSEAENRGEVRYFENIAPPSALHVPFKKRKVLQDNNASEKFDKFVQNIATKTDSLNLEAARRPYSDRSSWFKELPLAEKLRRAHEFGKLVSLENLDPSYTSPEVEDLVWHAFHERVEAKMLQCDAFSSPHSGKALVIFKSKDAADLAISSLRRRCLMLADGRPIVGSRATFGEPGKFTRFTGHLIIDKIRPKQNKNAVSTAHCSQPNTIEYDLAIQWCVLQKQSDEWWKALYKKQEKDRQDLRSQLKMNLIDEN